MWLYADYMVDVDKIAAGYYCTRTILLLYSKFGCATTAVGCITLLTPQTRYHNNNITYCTTMRTTRTRSLLNYIIIHIIAPMLSVDDEQDDYLEKLASICIYAALAADLPP